MNEPYSDRKQQIVNTAIQIIAEEGMRKLTMMNIARRIGISDAALYRHFVNKQDMTQAVIQTVGRNLISRISAEVSEIEDPVEKLREILRIHLTYIENNKGIPKILFSEAVHQHDPQLRRSVLAMVDHYLDLIRGIMIRAVERGRLRRDLDIDMAAMAFLGLVQSTVLIWSLSDFAFSPQDRVEGLWQVFFAGVQ